MKRAATMQLQTVGNIVAAVYNKGGVICSVAILEYCVRR